MKVTIEIPSNYYEGEWIGDDGSVIHSTTNTAYETLAAAETDWKHFAFEMADIIGEKLKEISDEHEKRNTHLEKCYHQTSLF